MTPYRCSCGANLRPIQSTITIGAGHITQLKYRRLLQQEVAAVIAAAPLSIYFGSGTGEIRQYEHGRTLLVQHDILNANGVRIWTGHPRRVPAEATP